MQVNGFRATFGDSASLILNCEAPGCAPPRFYLPAYLAAYTKLGRPERRVFPWDGRVSDGGNGLTHPLELELDVTVRRRETQLIVPAVEVAEATES
eukprot:COSAG05_NODE_303_length_11737_cov_116.354270_9_plen_96_part_00